MNPLLNEEQRRILEEAYLRCWNVPILSPGAGRIVQARWRSARNTIHMYQLREIIKRVEDYGWNIVVIHGQRVSLYSRYDKKALITVNRNEGVSDDVRWLLQPRELMQIVTICMFLRHPLNYHLPENNPFIHASNSEVINSFLIGRHGLESPKAITLYGQSETSTKEIVIISGYSGRTISIAKDKFETFIFSNPNLHKLFIQMLAKAGGEQSGIISVDEYMELRKLHDKKEAREQMKKLFDVLYDISLDGKQRIRILESWDKQNFEYSFTSKFLAHIGSKEAYPTLYPKQIFALKNPTAYWVAVIASNTKRVKASKTGQNSDKINIGRLLQQLYLPDPMPGRSGKQTIIDPLMKAFDVLRDNQIMDCKLVYSGVDGKVLDKSDPNYYKAWQNVAYLKTLCIHIDWLCNEPDYSLTRNRAKQQRKRTSKKRS